jgi:hypothetical protein
VGGAASGVSPSRLVVAACWLAITALFNLIWELAQLPLYTIWTERPHRAAFLAALHCTAGDVAIAAVTLIVALLLFGRTWPAMNFLRVAVATIVLAVAYTIFSEWLNISIRVAWRYSPLMPAIPWLGTGVAPLLQWIVVPSVAFFLVGPRRLHSWTSIMPKGPFGRGDRGV